MQQLEGKDATMIKLKFKIGQKVKCIEGSLNLYKTSGWKLGRVLTINSTTASPGVGKNEYYFKECAGIYEDDLKAYAANWREVFE